MAAFEALTALYTKATSEETSDARSAAAAELASGVEAAGVASIMSMALPAKVMASFCLLYTSPSPRDQRGSRMPSSA